MTLDEGAKDDAVTRLYEAYREADPIPPLRESYDLTLADGYEIGRRFVERRRDDEGAVAGYKIGATNRAVQESLGLDEPMAGRLPHGTIRSGRTIDADGLIEPYVEPEIAFVLDRAPDVPATPLGVLAATRAVVPAIEVVDSRIRGWDVTPPEAAADNVLAAALVPGPRLHAVDGVDLSLEGVEVVVDGDRRATGVGADVLGHPARAVAWLADHLDGRDETLGAGDVVTTGSMTPRVRVEAGDAVTCRFATLGTLTLHVA